MTLTGGTSQACAACKYQRRRCSSECPLAPYFPPDQPKMFQNAHKLFGVSNILKILKQLNTVQKMEAMRSIIYQANIRDRFPVHGCCWVITQLLYQIQQAKDELYAVFAQIVFFQQQQQQQETNNNNNANDSASQLQVVSLFHREAPVNAAAAALPIASSYPNIAAAYSSGYPDHKDNLVNSFWVQQHPYFNGNNNSSSSNNNNNNNNNNISKAMQSQIVSSPQLIIQQEQAQEYYEMPPFFDMIDDRQPYIDSKEAYDSSSDSSLKDTTQSVEHVAYNELKSAAACFSLTSVS